MRDVPVAQLQSGDVLAKPIFSRSGVILLDAGTVLTDAYITRLRSLGIDRVSLRFAPGSLWTDPSSPDAYDMSQAEWVLPDIARMKGDAESRKTAVQNALDFPEKMKGLERIALPIPQDKFRKQLRDMIGDIVSNRELAEELGVMFQTDPLLFQQSLHVTMCAGVIGTARNYDPQELYALTLGSLFSDVGMTRLPNDLTKVTRELTESERFKVRGHTTEGYRILSRIPGVPLESAKVALQHHERYRGEGYPYGLKRGEISEFAQIVGIADVYNALLSSRYHREAYAVEEATEYLFAAGNYEFDLSLIQTYLRHLTIYPVSTHVVLSSGQTACVVETVNRPVLRPVVQVYREADGSAIASPYLVDLEQHPTLAILRRIRSS
ncbi:HD-GYP domain-containing protein [Cohnella caldifontis]|uniref:HD-GYP domain-containing protein n=1 Tax=Cohnella caldifontis TaxID=3027471 RepID=UPI0023EC4437|nr:HD domain-containing phosphohydrolase [Cohnella sp. YIM B05605]